MNIENYVSKDKKFEFRDFWQKVTYFKYFHEITIFIGLLIIGLVISILTPSFLTVSNIFIILQQVSITTIVAFGSAMIIISGGIDLSVGTIIVFLGLPLAKIVLAGDGAPLYIALAILVSLLAGAFIGFINGVNVVFLRIPAFIATLAMMQVGRGLVLTLTGGSPIFGLPMSLVKIGIGFVGKVPVPVIIMAAVFVIVTYMMERTSLGRIIYSIGLNEKGTMLAGINVKKIKLLVYTIGGLCVGLGSIIYTARFGSVQPSSATTTAPLMFNAIAAAILGGVALSGGTGTMLGVLIGSIIIGVVTNGLALLNVNPHARTIILGVIVLISILVSSLSSKRDLGKK